MLRFGLPNKGSLGDASVQLLEDAGYAVRRDGRQLVVHDVEGSVDFFYLRPRDVAVYVSAGSLDLGITGRDLLIDSKAEAPETLALGFGRSSFRFAAKSNAVSTVTGLSGRRVATSFPTITGDYLASLGIDAELVRLDGAVEVSIELGVADAIADVVETGATLEAAGLSVFGDPVLESEAVLIRCDKGESSAAGQTVLERLKGVLVARSYVMIDFDCPVTVRDAAFAIAPGIESPTVSPLAKDGWIAVRTLVPRKGSQAVMDRLWQIGARAILQSSLESTRL